VGKCGCLTWVVAEELVEVLLWELSWLGKAWRSEILGKVGENSSLSD
jgi:hypothetical protein